MILPLKLAMLAAQVRQYEIAQRAGLTETRISRLATGRAAPTQDERQRIARALGKPIAELFPTTSKSAP